MILSCSVWMGPVPAQEPEIIPPPLSLNVLYSQSSGFNSRLLNGSRASLGTKIRPSSNSSMYFILNRRGSILSFCLTGSRASLYCRNQKPFLLLLQRNGLQYQSQGFDSLFFPCKSRNQKPSLLLQHILTFFIANRRGSIPAFWTVPVPAQESETHPSSLMNTFSPNRRGSIPALNQFLDELVLSCAIPFRFLPFQFHSFYIAQCKVRQIYKSENMSLIPT